LAAEPFGDAVARKAPTQEIFAYEARREGRTVAVLRGTASENGSVVVETEIFPVTAPANSDPQTREHRFSTREQARRFAEETVLTLEYLGCVLAE
jgi:hypothetical protein